MKTIKNKYDIYKNDWLMDTINELDRIDDLKHYTETRNALRAHVMFKSVRKSRTALNKADIRKTKVAKRQLIQEVNENALKKAFLEQDATCKFIMNVEISKRKEDINNGILGHVAQCFINKYDGADTSIAMRTLAKQKFHERVLYDDLIRRRENRNIQNYKEKAFMKLRAARRKYAQRTK